MSIRVSFFPQAIGTKKALSRWQGIYLDAHNTETHAFCFTQQTDVLFQGLMQHHGCALYDKAGHG